MAVVYLGLGSNIGDRLKNIEKAVSLLSEHVQILRISTPIETDPVGGPPQEKYINAVLKATTLLSARQLLSKTQEIENSAGRIRTPIPNAPRVIDIDILLYNNDRIHENDLIVPHPRMLKRNFVMQPLAEIDQDLAIALLKENP
jgi:2-amino-4-hydroxy-6-hydroxymethyldihydropteridine diphosphokinase